MAYYENLLIYKKSMELAVFLETVVRNFSRYNKYGIGAELRDKSRRLFTLVIPELGTARRGARRAPICSAWRGVLLNSRPTEEGACHAPLRGCSNSLRMPYVVIGESGYQANGLKRRVVTEKLTFYGGRA